MSNQDCIGACLFFGLIAYIAVGFLASIGVVLVLLALLWESGGTGS